MERLVVATTIYRPPPEVYAFLVDFPGYANYSKYLEEVVSEGHGEGRRYALTFAWWKLTYTAHAEVTELVEPERIEWRIRSDLDARGRWRVEPVEEAELPADAAVGDDPGDADDDDRDADPIAPASRAVFEAEYDPGSVHGGMFDLPRLVSLDWVLKKAKPLIREEATRVVERAVDDIEGQRREVELEVTLVDE
ncbi:MAG: SRPBCC family protein [Halolamina sp.]